MGDDGEGRWVIPTYHEFKDRKPSIQYRRALEIVRSSPIRDHTKQGIDVLAAVGVESRFPVAEGASVITERSIAAFVPKAIGELCAFINGARTLDELADFGCDWWGPWATEEKCGARGLSTGDLGPGSYGHAFHNFTTNLDDRSDPGFDQFSHLINKLTDVPNDRTAVVSPWIPQANERGRDVRSRNTIAPCHGWLHVLVFGERFHLIHNQRSGDLPIGVPANMAQYFALGLMIEQVTGFEFAEYVHWIQYAHIYVDQLGTVDEMLLRDARPLPTLRLTSDGQRVHDIHDFRASHFELLDYKPHPAIARIPVSV